MIKVKGDIKKALQELKNNQNNAVSQVFEDVKFSKGLLNGATFTIKDLYATTFGKTQASSKILENFQPGYDASIIKKIIANGGAIVAKVHCDELGMGGSGEFSAFGKITHPLDKNRIVGGSSSGSAATFTKNISFSIGSDTGDSIRLPASYNGYVGFKPSYGAISRFGLFAYASSMDTVGMFAHNVHDVITLSRVLFGFDKKDLTSKEVTVPNQNLVKPQSIAILNDEINVLDKTMANKFQQFVTRLQNDGVKVKKVTIDLKLLKAINAVYKIISYSEALSNDANLTGLAFGNRQNGDNVNDVITNSRTKGFGPMVKRRFTLGAFFLDDKNQHDIFIRSQKVRTLIKKAFNEVLENYDLLLFPATKIAPLLNEDKLNDWHDSYLSFSNLIGTPSIALPFSKLGKMPFGLNLDAKLYDDKKLLSYALYIEKMIEKGGYND